MISDLSENIQNIFRDLFQSILKSASCNQKRQFKDTLLCTKVYEIEHFKVFSSPYNMAYVAKFNVYDAQYYDKESST